MKRCACSRVMVCLFLMFGRKLRIKSLNSSAILAAALIETASRSFPNCGLEEVGSRYLIHGIVELPIKIINPELVEVTEHHVAWTVRDGVEPIIKRLLIMLL